MGAYLHHPAVNFPIRSEVGIISDDIIKNFCSFTCGAIEEFRPILKLAQRYDTSFFFAYNPLRGLPLIRTGLLGAQNITCPLPTLLFWKFTGGLYYNLLSDARFFQAFGAAFQNYVGEAIRRACPNPKFRLLPEQSYRLGKDRKDTVDWIFAGEEAAIFLECKAKRLTWDAKVALDDLTPLSDDIDVLANAIVQTYKNIEEYQKGHYPHFAFDEDRRIYPIVVTLENWHLFGPVLLPMVHKAVEDMLADTGISVAVLTEMPFAIWHVGELERAFDIINAVGIRAFIDIKLDDSEMKDWQWSRYIAHTFGKRFPRRTLFSAEYDAIFARVRL